MAAAQPPPQPPQPPPPPPPGREYTVEPGVNMLTAAEIRVAVLPVGRVPREAMEGLLAAGGGLSAHRHVPLAAARSFYRESPGAKSPFSHLPWASGALHFRFLGEAEARRRSRVVDLHAQRQARTPASVWLGG